MKKTLKIIIVFLLVFMVTACGNSNSIEKNASVEELLDIYIDGFKNIDTEKMISIYPDFAHDYFAKFITKDMVTKALENFGDDVKMTYEITGKEKMSQEDLEYLNDAIKKTFSNYVLASECYNIKGSTTTKGSKDETTNSLDGMWYCNFDGTWRLLGD